jgi:hypothetical protein
MEFVPGPGLCRDPGLGLPEKSLQTLYGGFAAKVAGHEFLKAFSYYGIDGGLSSKSQSPRLLKKFFIYFERNIRHFGDSGKRFKHKIAQALCYVKVTRTVVPCPGSDCI